MEFQTAKRCKRIKQLPSDLLGEIFLFLIFDQREWYSLLCISKEWNQILNQQYIIENFWWIMEPKEYESKWIPRFELPLMISIKKLMLKGNGHYVAGMYYFDSIWIKSIPKYLKNVQHLWVNNSKIRGVGNLQLESLRI